MGLLIFILIIGGMLALGALGRRAGTGAGRRSRDPNTYNYYDSGYDTGGHHHGGSDHGGDWGGGDSGGGDSGGGDSGGGD